MECQQNAFRGSAEGEPKTMSVLVAPKSVRKLSGFMFSAAVVGILAESGLEGVDAATAGAEFFPDGAPGPLLLEVPR